MRWSVSARRRGRPCGHPRRDRRAGRRGGRQRRDRLRHRDGQLRRARWSSRRRRCDEAVEAGGDRVFRAAAAQAGLPPWPVTRAEAIGEDDDDRVGRARDPARLAGRLPVRGAAGARRLDAAGPPGASTPSLYKPEPEAKPEQYAVIYVGHADDLSAERFPFKHPRAACWVRRAGSRWQVYICTYEVPGGLRSHREQIARELAAIYRPSCNERAVRPGVEGRVDRRVLRADRRPAHHRPRPRRPSPVDLTAAHAGSLTLLGETRSSRGTGAAPGRSRPRRAAGTGGARRPGGPVAARRLGRLRRWRRRRCPRPCRTAAAARRRSRRRCG